MNFPEIKDRRRIRDIYKSSSDRQIGLAVKMAKLITDSKKAERRWRAAIDLFGSSHSVTQIFNQRMRELTGSITTVSLAVTTATTAPSTEIKNKAKKEHTPKSETVEVVLNRSKKDFPVGCTVKNKNTDRKGVVSAHDSEDLNVVTVQFEDENVEVNIYLLKRA